MKQRPKSSLPLDHAARTQSPVVICYPNHCVPAANMKRLKRMRAQLKPINRVRVPPRQARCIKVRNGQFFRVLCAEGPQVGDLNLWSASNLDERFYASKTRAFYGTHLSTSDRLFSSFPYLRPMATITYDTLDWYGWDQDGASVHDVIGSRCDPYTQKLLHGNDYHYCCHSNLTRALAYDQNLPLEQAEAYVHDVVNVFMCTGFTHDTHQYFMKASPVRQHDYLEFFAEMDLVVGLSACPGGDCASEHSSDAAQCHALEIEVLESTTGSKSR